MNRIHTLALVLTLLLGVLSAGTARADQAYLDGDLVCSAHSQVALIRFALAWDDFPPVYPRLPRRLDDGLSHARSGQHTDCTLPGGHKLRIRLGENPGAYFSLWIDKHIVLSRKQWRPPYDNNGNDQPWIVAVVIRPGQLSFCTGPHEDREHDPVRCTSQAYDLAKLRYDRVEYPTDGSTPRFGTLSIAKGAPDPALCERYLASMRNELGDFTAGYPDDTKFAAKLSYTSPDPTRESWPAVAVTQIEPGGPSYKITRFSDTMKMFDADNIFITPLDTPLAKIAAVERGLEDKVSGPWPAGWAVITGGQASIYPDLPSRFVHAYPVRIDGRLYFLAFPVGLYPVAPRDPGALLIGLSPDLKLHIACRINQVPVNYG